MKQGVDQGVLNNMNGSSVGYYLTIERAIKEHRYTTKTEFIREAIRDKLKEIENQDLLKKAALLAGSSKRETTDDELHKAGERVVKIYEKRYGLK